MSRTATFIIYLATDPHLKIFGPGSQGPVYKITRFLSIFQDVLKMEALQAHCTASRELTKLPFLLTLLKSLAVQLSSSLHGMRWTNANIWYLAFINSVLFGLLGQHEAEEETQRAGISRQLARGTLTFNVQQPVSVHKFNDNLCDAGLFSNNYDSLHFVLRIGLSLSTHHRGRVQ